MRLFVESLAVGMAVFLCVFGGLLLFDQMKPDYVTYNTVYCTVNNTALAEAGYFDSD